MAKDLLYFGQNIKYVASILARINVDFGQNKYSGQPKIFPFKNNSFLK